VASATAETATKVIDIVALLILETSIFKHKAIVI